MKHRKLCLSVAVGVLLSTIVVATAAPAAPTPIVGGNSFGTAVQISPTVEYIGGVSNTHTSDYFYFTVSPGQIVTVTFSSTANWANTAFFNLYNQAQTQLGPNISFNGASQANQFVWMGNNTTPTKYYFKVANSPSIGLNQYLFQVTIADQTDGGSTGDAGDDLNSARVIALSTVTPTLAAPGNLLGASDTDDYFLIKLPPLLPFEQPVPYRFYLNATSWPAVAGYNIRLYAFDSQKNPLPSLGKIINNPSATVFSEDITNCGSDGCYFQVHTGFPTNRYYPVVYTIRAAPTYFLYLPLIIR